MSRSWVQLGDTLQVPRICIVEMEIDDSLLGHRPGLKTSSMKGHGRANNSAYTGVDGSST